MHQIAWNIRYKSLHLATYRIAIHPAKGFLRVDILSENDLKVTTAIFEDMGDVLSSSLAL